LQPESSEDAPGKMPAAGADAAFFVAPPADARRTTSAGKSACGYSAIRPETSCRLFALCSQLRVLVSRKDSLSPMQNLTRLSFVHLLSHTPIATLRASTLIGGQVRLAKSVHIALSFDAFSRNTLAGTANTGDAISATPTLLFRF